MEQFSSPGIVPRDRANRHLMEAEIHQRLEDRAERERERELPELDIAQRPAGDDEENQEQDGAAGGDARVRDVPDHQRWSSTVDSTSCAYRFMSAPSSNPAATVR